ncbi:MAG: 30S ribosomal protein S30 [endosymbiont of Galathealinum brachiosum]|uniref:30S ribosomal protein S30 n=1 Tax=endosymbiont of Galathealinum brachiosum TaxID=2200906 RepID=A0A370DLX2_9GAMM|nr:MAG: 30S ribosomal protein S30 [endosymbiont of Galathealinum brachiosum]
MQIDIQARHFSLTDALRNHAERKLRFTLTCCDEHIQKIVMRLSDVNGPRGGSDMHCHVQVVLAGLPDVVIEDTESDMYVAINRAIERAGRTLIRKIDRQHTLSKQANTKAFEIEQPVTDETVNEMNRGL